jgi:hypothetical protein
MAANWPWMPGCRDAGMLRSAPTLPDGKIQTLASRLKEIWLSTTALSGTQLVFCDLGVNPSP